MLLVAAVLVGGARLRFDASCGPALVQLHMKRQRAAHATDSIRARAMSEDDVSSLRDRSLIVAASTMLVEVSLSKLLISILIMILLPAVLLGPGAGAGERLVFPVLPRETAAAS